jgi:hypothetical protein
MTRETRKGTAAVLAMLTYCGALSLAQGQLAITEVMSESEVLSDYWELTNFGTNAINLTGYGVGDNHGFDGRHTHSFLNVVIEPNESIVFVLNGDATEFVEIWGPSLTNRVIQQPTGFNINEAGEVLSLWDEQGRLVDSIEVPPAVEGVSYTYNLETGKLDQRSEWISAALLKP